MKKNNEKEKHTIIGKLVGQIKKDKLTFAV